VKYAMKHAAAVGSLMLAMSGCGMGSSEVPRPEPTAPNSSTYEQELITERIELVDESGVTHVGTAIGSKATDLKKAFGQATFFHHSEPSALKPFAERLGEAKRATEAQVALDPNVKVAALIPEESGLGWTGPMIPYDDAPPTLGQRLPYTDYGQDLTTFYSPYPFPDAYTQCRYCFGASANGFMYSGSTSGAGMHFRDCSVGGCSCSPSNYQLLYSPVAVTTSSPNFSWSFNGTSAWYLIEQAQISPWGNSTGTSQTSTNIRCY